MRLRFAPPWAAKALAKFGFNPYGLPHFRVIWGPSRTYIAGGFYHDIQKCQYRQLLKYGQDPKWILERWRPASIYGSPAAWDTQTLTPEGYLALGPFPSHGEYEAIVTFSEGKGIQGYVPLEPGLLELSARAVWMGRANSYSDIREHLRNEELRKEKLQDEKFDGIWAERQLTRPGLTMGAGAVVNKQQEIDDYARRIERSKAWVNANKFRPGFHQK